MTKWKPPEPPPKTLWEKIKESLPVIFAITVWVVITILVVAQVIVSSESVISAIVCVPIALLVMLWLAASALG